MLDYDDVEAKALLVIKNFSHMNDKSNEDLLAVKIHELGLSGGIDPSARPNSLCMELKTVFFQASGNLPILHLDLKPSTLTDHSNWTIDQLISRIAHSLYSLNKEEVR